LAETFPQKTRQQFDIFPLVMNCAQIFKIAKNKRRGMYVMLKFLANFWKDRYISFN